MTCRSTVEKESSFQTLGYLRMYEGEGIVMAWFYCFKSSCSESYGNPWCSASKPLELCNGSSESWQLWVAFPIVEWHWSGLELQSSLQKHLSLLFPCSPGTHKCQHNQHLESFLRSVDEKGSLRAQYFPAITCQVSGLQSLCYSEELEALDVCMNPFTSTLLLWWWSFPFGTKIYYDQSLTKLNKCLPTAAALSECKTNALKEVLKFENVLFWETLSLF